MTANFAGLALADKIQHILDNKTKPQGSLGRLERLAKQIALLQGSLEPKLLNPHMLLFAADHGIAARGVSAYPSEVTAQMVHNFLQGGAAINVLCRQHQIQLQLVDAGVNADFDANTQLLHAKIASGTGDFSRGLAMSEQQLQECFTRAEALVQKLQAKGCNVVGFGEMGIGNTASASMLMYALFGLELEACVGRGTGLDDAGLQRKLEILREAAALHGRPQQAMQALQCYGGFEIAQMAAAMLYAAKAGMLLLIDGFIACSALLCARQLHDGIMHNCIFSHCSNEQGHRLMLQQLGAEPLLDLQLRLGEGSGAALAWPLVKSAVAIFNEMASFQSAGVCNTI